MPIPSKENAKATLTIYRNLPWSQKMRHVDAEGRPIDLTGWDGRLEIRASLDPAATLHHFFTTSDGSMVLGNGVIELKIPLAGTTLAFSWNEGVGHLVLKEPGEVPTVQALFAFAVRNSTTGTPP